MFLFAKMKRMSESCEINNTSALKKISLISTVADKNQKSTSNGHDTCATHRCKGIKCFERLLKRRDPFATWQEIEVFLKAGYRLNGYGSENQWGYMAQIFRFQKKDMHSVEKSLKKEIFSRILNDPQISEVDDAGRTAIHNIVSIEHVRNTSDDENLRPETGWFCGEASVVVPINCCEQDIMDAFNNARRSSVINTFYEDFYAEIIKRLLDQGCDIDHENNEGKTALHLAMMFGNNRTIIPLLKMGADINIIDKNGKSAFAYSKEATKKTLGHMDYWRNYKYEYADSHYANKIFAVHVYKLEVCGEHVDDQNQKLQCETLEMFGPIAEKVLDRFHKEVERTKTLNIGKTSLKLYDFLMKPDTDIVCMNMAIEQNREMELFFENIDQHKFDEISGLLRLKYKRISERIILIEPAILFLTVLIKFELPGLCSRYILRFLKNRDLKHLIASVE